MKTAWGQAVFDGFLLEDLPTWRRGTGRARSSPGRGERDGDVATGDEHKVITLRASPGARFDDPQHSSSTGQERVRTIFSTAIVRARGLGWRPGCGPPTLPNGPRAVLPVEGQPGGRVTVGGSGHSARRPPLCRCASLRADVSDRVRRSPRDEWPHPRATCARHSALPTTPRTCRPRSSPPDASVELTYLRDGYNDVRVSVTTLVDRERARVDIALTVAEGRQQVLAGVDVSGAGVDHPGRVDRALNLEPGQPVNRTDVLPRAKATLRHRRVPERGRRHRAGRRRAGDEAGPQPVRAAVTLLELPRYRFRYGVRLNDEVGPTEVGREVRPALVADLLRRNLLGRAVSTGVAGQIETDRRLARGFVSLPQMFGLPVTSNLFLTRSREDFTPEGSAFVEDKSDVTVEQRFRPARNMAVTYNYSFARNHVFELDQIPGVPRLDATFNVARLTGTYALGHARRSVRRAARVLPFLRHRVRGRGARFRSPLRPILRAGVLLQEPRGQRRAGVGVSPRRRPRVQPGPHPEREVLRRRRDERAWLSRRTALANSISSAVPLVVTPCCCSIRKCVSRSSDGCAASASSMPATCSPRSGTCR